MNKQPGLYSFDGILLSNKKWAIDTQNKLDESERQYAE